MKTFSALLALSNGESPVTGGFPLQRPVTRGFAVFFDSSLYKRLGKQSRRRWFETPLRLLWRHCNTTTLADLTNTLFSKLCWGVCCVFLENTGKGWVQKETGAISLVKTIQHNRFEMEDELDYEIIWTLFYHNKQIGGRLFALCRNKDCLYNGKAQRAAYCLCLRATHTNKI